MFFVMRGRSPRSTRSYARSPYTTLVRSQERGSRGRRVLRGDLYSAIVLDVDLGAGLLDDLADHLAAGADHFTDLVLRHRDGGDARRVFLDAGTVLRNRLGHLTQDIDRTSVVSGKSVSDSVDLGGRLNLKKKKLDTKHAIINKHIQN